jgi:hypothetical protein
MVGAAAKILFYFIFIFYLTTSKEKKKARKRKRKESFETCFRILALLVGRNVTTQAPSCNNASSLQRQQ